MKRSMSRQAEAERERRARVISADGELQASYKLAQAAATMADTPTALQLRLLETVVEVAAEKNSTLVLPFPVELLRFLEKAPGAPAPAASAPADAGPADAARPADRSPEVSAPDVSPVAIPPAAATPPAAAIPPPLDARAVAAAESGTGPGDSRDTP